jgi:quercetin dioxygenase-like cupin family protein
LHVHRSDDEAWIVLEGQLGSRVCEEEHVVAAGESLLAPKGMPHSYWNPAAEPASVSVYENEAGAEASNDAAAAWLGENLPNLAGAAPQVWAAEVVIDL